MTYIRIRLTYYYYHSINMYICLYGKRIIEVNSFLFRIFLHREFTPIGFVLNKQNRLHNFPHGSIDAVVVSACEAITLTPKY